MELTCDFCGVEDDDLIWDDIHEKFSPIMCMFLCKLCAKINDAQWQFDAINIRINMEIQSIKRALGRMQSNV